MCHRAVPLAGDGPFYFWGCRMNRIYVAVSSDDHCVACKEFEESELMERNGTLSSLNSSYRWRLVEHVDFPRRGEALYSWLERHGVRVDIPGRQKKTEEIPA